MPRKAKPPAPRPKGTGSVYLRKDGRYGAALWLADPATGERRRKVAYAPTREAARAILDGWLAEVERGTLAAGRDLTLGAWLDHWLDNIAATRVRPRVLVRYRELARHAHILRETPLLKLKPADLQRLYRAKLRPVGAVRSAGLAPRTVGHVHRVLHAALQDAVKADQTPRNVCDLVSPPRVPSAEMATLATADVGRFLAAVTGDDLEALFVLALCTGARLGELLGLTWRDIDLAGGRLHIRQTLVRDRQGKAWRLSEPKTVKSRRSLPLIPLAGRALEAHRARQVAWRLRAGPAWAGHDLVFTDERGEPPYPQDVTRKRLKPILKRAGLPPLRFHDLRHSAISYLLARRIPPHIVSEIAGHSSAKTTLGIYAHVLVGDTEDAFDALSGMLEAGDRT